MFMGLIIANNSNRSDYSSKQAENENPLFIKKRKSQFFGD